MNHTEEKDYILSVLAQNHAGVLLRIAGLFSRRCYNIKSIVAAQTEDNNRSRILIVVQGDDRIVRQVDKHANILNVSSTDMIVELTGTPSTLDSFVECCKPYHIVKILRTGTMAMEK